MRTRLFKANAICTRLNISYALFSSLNCASQSKVIQLSAHPGKTDFGLCAGKCATQAPYRSLSNIIRSTGAVIVPVAAMAELNAMAAVAAMANALNFLKSDKCFITSAPVKCCDLSLCEIYVFANSEMAKITYFRRI